MGNIILISRKGKRIGERDIICSCCHLERNPVWRYSESNIGTVCLCSECKVKIFENSFDRIDISNLRLCEQGGGFETNRRKH